MWKDAAKPSCRRSSNSACGDSAGYAWVKSFPSKWNLRVCLVQCDLVCRQGAPSPPCEAACLLHVVRLFA